MQKPNQLFVLLTVFLAASLSAHGESFNSNEVINHHGSKNKLAADEGYLYLSLDTNTDISRITIDAVGLSKKIRFNDIKRGSNHALLKVKAGEYYWEHINIFVGIGAIRKYLSKDDFSFKVKPGVVNYPGTWSFSGEWISNLRAKMNLEVYNYLSYEIEHYKSQFKNFAGKIPFEYQGAISDPYADFLTKTIEQIDKDKPTPNLFYRKEKPDELPMTVLTKLSSTVSADMLYPQIKDYFQYDSQSIRSVSPNESYLLFSAVLDDVVSVGVISVENFETYLFYQQKLPSNSQVSELEWIDSDSFFMTLSNKDQDRSYVAHLNIDEQEKTINAQFLKFRYSGYLLSGLTKEPNSLFFVKDSEAGSSQKNGLYKVDASDEKSIDSSFKKIYKNTKKLKNVVDWLVDKSGDVRAAITVSYNKKKEESILDYWYLEDAQTNDWVKIKTVVGTDDIFWLMAISDDEHYFMVLTNEFSDKYAIHKYATADGAHLGVLYENPEHDINNVLLASNDQQVVGYTYFENGLLQAHYFNQLDEKFTLARANNPDLQLFQVQELNQFNRLLLFGVAPNSRGAWYVLDKDSGLADKVFDISPNYEKLPKGQYHVLHSKAEDGVDLEGFLVMPELEDNAKAPLIVMPHGGPIGVRDMAHNSEMQHFLASQGFATLKVNYRGSGGYGKAFEELGKRQWGEKIEQDIFTMTEHALDLHSLDGTKICAMGGSYGGYSALMLTHLYPETYLCAVSFAGVMDLPLLFTSRDLSNNPEVQQVMTEIVGDPINEINKLVSKSPLYLLKKMKKPLLLFQGLNDSRVRPEHALRMQQLISLYEMNHEVVLFQDEGHSFSQKNTVLLYLDKSIKFIKKNLQIE